MTRIAKHILIQPLEVEIGAPPDAVILNEETGEEVVIQAESIRLAIDVLAYIAGDRARPPLGV